ncbi:MAG: hypothetical protein ICV81_13780 [Flavisolibacter sp.]|nr:hypothetical protein [Flavisolibacter sp.]MBD0294086.1 hypothetical protein [Flavisolibacter sp.]MBD0352452.1 hypothetical protein [Flavisolibacter sp.]MBD0367220.1 hypothetical protein [Flavisolibacter sp.]
MLFFLLYIDPGSGSFLVQAIVAAVLGVAFYFRNFFTHVKTFFTGIFRKKQKKA